MGFGLFSNQHKSTMHGIVFFFGMKHTEKDVFGKDRFEKNKSHFGTVSSGFR